MPEGHCYRIPPGVEFLRWECDGEWVVYHSGTGETLRLTDAALFVLDLVQQAGSMSADEIGLALVDMLDDSFPPDDLASSVAELIRLLLRHECIEKATCA